MNPDSIAQAFYYIKIGLFCFIVIVVLAAAQFELNSREKK